MTIGSGWQANGMIQRDQKKQEMTRKRAERDAMKATMAEAEAAERARLNARRAEVQSKQPQA